MMELSKNGTRTVNKGSADFFTGNVQVEPLAQGKDPARVSAGKVTFEPCARSAWHTHPLGQMLIVTDGCGLIQEWGKPAQVIRPGDVIWTPPGVKHWHGASADSKLTHIAIQESLNGKKVAMTLDTSLRARLIKTAAALAVLTSKNGAFANVE
jgi:quercetin dioxygenase-like cupin family protein